MTNLPQQLENIFKEACSELNIPPFTRSVAHSLLSKKSCPDLKALCHTCLSLSGKITGNPITLPNFDVNFECELVHSIDFNFDPLNAYDLYELVFSTANEKNRITEDDLEERLKRVDLFNKNETVNAVFGLFKKEDVEMFLRVNLIAWKGAVVE